jgi:orotate phosphoribosyltransferase
VFSIRKDQKTYGRRNWLEGRVLDNKLTMLVDDIVSETHKTAIHGASILFNQGIPIANTAYATVHKTHTPKNNKIKLLNSEITVRSMFCLNDFDLTLEAYNKKKQRYPWT